MARVPRFRSCPLQHQVAGVSALVPHVLGRVDEHAAGAGRRVADAHPLARLQQLDDEAHHLAGRVELAALPAGVIGEPVDQVFIGVPPGRCRWRRPSRAGSHRAGRGH